MRKMNLLILTATALLFTACATPNAVEQDSKVAWEGTKKVSGEVWEGTKQVSGEAWQGTKKAVNDVTAD